MNAAERRRSPAMMLLIVLWGGLLSAWLVRGFFAHPPGEIHATHEQHSYVYRVVEFRDALAAGYLSPQWCSHFRGGLGSPHFSYYQPAFFYPASFFAWWLDPVKALGATVWCFALVGFLSTYRLIAQRFDSASGLLAASLLLLAAYSGAELYVRGDLTEFAAMMFVPLLLVSLIGWQEHGAAWRFAATSLVFAAITTMHPCVALPTLLLAVAVAIGYAVAQRHWLRAGLSGVAIVLGGLLAAFYWMPIAREWNLVQADNAFSGYYHYTRHFVNPLWLIGPYRREVGMPLTLGQIMPLLALLNVVGLAFRWKTLAPTQRRLAMTLLICFIVGVFMITPFSASLWSIATPLQKLQFPWRLLTLITVALAGLCGPVALMLQPRSRWLLVAGLIALAWWRAVPYSQRSPPMKFRPVATASDMAQDWFAPDLTDEWLPRGAQPIKPTAMPVQPTATAGVEVSDYRLASGKLSCKVSSPAAGGVVTLPHYLFAGWQATFAGKPCSLEADEQGLMTVVLEPAASGELVAQFTSTPAKRLGWLVSILSLTALVGLSIGVHFWQPPESQQ